MASSQLVVFSNVDGVLREPSSTAVVSAVSQLDRASVPLVLCSGNTRAEIEHAALLLGTRHPFLCEHGNALFIPHGYFPFRINNSREIAGYDVVEFGRSYPFVVSTLTRAAARLGVEIRGFHEMSVEEVAEDCDMSMLSARLAKLRDYGELFRVLNPTAAPLDRLTTALEDARLRCTRGQRYHHVGAAVDMRVGIGMLHVMYERAFGTIRTAAMVSPGIGEPFRRVVSTTAAIETDTPIAWTAAVEELLDAYVPPGRVATSLGERIL